MKWLKGFSVSCLLLISLFFYYIPVFAEQTYYVVPDEADKIVYERGEFYKQSGTSEVRFCVLGTVSGSSLYMVSTTNDNKVFTSYYRYGTQLNTSTISINTSVNYNGVTYYYKQTTAGSGAPAFWADYFYNTYGSVDSTASAYNAVHYTFGAGAVDAGPEWGDLVDVGYKTTLAGNGSNIQNNLDTISWNPYTDDNGNLFDDSCYVDIRAVPGYYGASDRQSLLTQTANDFIKELTGSVTLTSIPATIGSYSVSWGSVCDYLNAAYPMSIQALSSLFNDNGSWIKKGWIYQYRLVADNYQSEWKDIYTLTSSGVQNDLTVINVTTIDQSLIDVQITNQEINQNLNIQIEYNDVLIPDIPTPSPTPVPTADPENPCTTCNVEIPDNSDWFLAIINTIRTTINGLKETISGLWSIEPEYLDQVDPNHEKQKFLDLNYFGDASQFLQNISDTWAQIENSPPVLQFDGITIQGETFIPATTINLNTIVEDMGISQYHELAYTMTDGIIYLSLFVLVINKIREATKGE